MQRMKHLLQLGQSFTCPRFRDDLVYKLVPGPSVDKTRFELDSRFITGFRDEEKPGGWKRSVQTQIDRRPDDWETLGDVVFRVIHTEMTGGGAGHGSGDRYPDGHRVIAEDSSGRRVRFYQSGCFQNMVPPGDVCLVGDEPEAPPGALW